MALHLTKFLYANAYHLAFYNSLRNLLPCAAVSSMADQQSSPEPDAAAFLAR